MCGRELKTDNLLQKPYKYSEIRKKEEEEVKVWKMVVCLPMNNLRASVKDGAMGTETRE